MKLKEHLLNLGMEQKRNFQFHDDDYYVVFLDEDSFGFEVYSIHNKRYDSTCFRGRILSNEEFDNIFLRVKEDYNLTDAEKVILQKEKDKNS